MKKLLLLLFLLPVSLFASALPSDTLWVTGYASVGADSLGNTVFCIEDSEMEGFENLHGCIRRIWSGDLMGIDQCRLEIHPDFPCDPGVLGLPTDWLTSISIPPPVKWAVAYPTATETGVRIVGKNILSVRVIADGGAELLTFFPEGDCAVLDTADLDAGVYRLEISTAEGETHFLKVLKPVK